jgi:AraC-like DNA-binding protein
MTRLSGTVPVGLLAHLRRARDHMDRQYQAELDLDQVARVAGVSKYHFAGVSKLRTASRRCAT